MKTKLKVERLGIVIAPSKGNDNAEFACGHISEFAAYNAGMALDGGIVHMLYRFSRNRPAEGFDIRNISCYTEDYICYAQLTPQGKLIKDYGKVIFPEHPLECAGCQDPRIIPFEGKYYITYCAWDMGLVKDTNKPRLAFAVTDDFKVYNKLGIIDMFAGNKDHFIFPERINGKIVLVHRIEPEIQMEFFNSFEDILNQSYWDKYKIHFDSAIKIKRKFEWESLKIGGGIPPIKTEAGWLFVYHGVRWEDEANYKPYYSAGVALLDLANPARVIARLPYPLIEPEAGYERYGDVDNVVFPMGGYVHEGFLYISYGGADKVVAMARVKLNELIGELLCHKE